MGFLLKYFAEMATVEEVVGTEDERETKLRRHHLAAWFQEFATISIEMRSLGELANQTYTNLAEGLRERTELLQEAVRSDIGPKGLLFCIKTFEDLPPPKTRSTLFTSSQDFVISKIMLNNEKIRTLKNKAEQLKINHAELKRRFQHLDAGRGIALGLTSANAAAMI